MKKCCYMVFLAILAFGCAKQSKSPAIATVGDREIPLYEITENFVQVGAPEFPSAEAELKAKRQYLDNQIETALLTKAAYAHGLDSDIEVLELVENERDKFLLDELFRVEIIEKTKISENEIRNWYKYWFTGVRARHILVDTEREADSLRTAIQGGGDFGAAARALSKDPMSRRRGGELGRVFYWGDLVEPFQEVLFNLKPNEISKPVHTDYGWHIIELLDRQERDNLPLDSVRTAITSKIKAIRQRERQIAHREELKKAYPIEIVPETVEFLKGKIAEFARVDTLVLPDSLRRDVDTNFLSELEREKPLARYLGDRVMSLGEYLRASNPRPPEGKPPLDNPEAVKDFVFEAVIYELLVEQAQREGLDKSDLYTRRIKEFKESMMAEKMKNTILRRGVTVTESELKDYFDANPQEFVEPLKLRVAEILSDTKEQADSVHRDFRAGAPFAKLAEQRTKRQGYQRNGGDLGYVKSYRQPEIHAVAETLKVGQVSAPFENNDGWSFIQLVERIEPQPRTFDQIKGELFTRLREARIESVYTAYVDSIKSTTPITINEELLTGTVDQAKYANRPAPADTQATPGGTK